MSPRAFARHTKPTRQKTHSIQLLEGKVEVVLGERDRGRVPTCAWQCKPFVKGPVQKWGKERVSGNDAWLRGGPRVSSAYHVVSNAAGNRKLTPAQRLHGLLLCSSANGSKRRGEAG